MKISRLIEMLQDCKELLGDVDVFFYNYNTFKEHRISGIDAEKDHINLVE
jgi:hypothetical protein